MSSKFKLKDYEKPEKGQNNEQNILLAVGFEVDFSSLFFLFPPRSTGGRCRIHEIRGATPPHPVDAIAVAMLYCQLG